MEATGWKFLPSQLLNEDDVLLNNVFSIAGRVQSLRGING
jgi:hypothetical protein